MLREFYTKTLPENGVYCVSSIVPNTDRKGMINKFTESIDEVLDLIEQSKNREHNTFVALGSYNGYSRSANDCIMYRSLFIDLDVGDEKAEEGKGYASKEDALIALSKFLETNSLPPPVVVDSGTGIHAYWLFQKAVPFKDYKPVAEKFKKFVMSQLYADPAVMADGARVMRCPNTFNYKTNPPSPSGFLSDKIYQYSFEVFKEFLGVSQEDLEVDIFASVSKGLDDDTRALLKLDNYAYNFSELVNRTFNGTGCNQIRNILVNAKTVSRDVWAGGLTIAIKCTDGATAIHKMSEDHPEYNYADTCKVANSFEKPRTCDWFNDNAPSVCDGCKYRGHIKSPISLARELKAVPEPDREPTKDELARATRPIFPGFLKPFVRGENGGIYYVPPAKVDKDGVSHSEDPMLVIPHDLYPIQRLYSVLDGECLTMRLLLPNDAVREFLLPMKDVYAQDRFKAIMASQGVLYNPTMINHLTQYIIKWGQYMVEKIQADIMRMQMGWTEDRVDEAAWRSKSFVIGNKEIQSDGSERVCAASPYVRGISKLIAPNGTYERWQESANRLNTEGLELHAFVMLGGFGSTLMCYTSTAGVAISLLGRSGCAKTGALYAALSIFGNPKDLSVFEATDNGMTGRYLALHNIMLGVDEIGNKDPKLLSQLIHKVSHGKAKIRMQASTNAEREYEQSASLIATFTTNESIYNKLEGIKASPDGEVARLIEFFVKQPEVLSGVEGGIIGRQIFDAFRFNYGHAGPLFVKEVFKVGDQFILDTMDYWRDRFARDFRSTDSSYRFYENLVQANMTAGTIAVKAGIVDLDLERVYRVVTKEMLHIKDKVVTVNKVDYQSVLGDFINKNITNILIIRDNKIAMEPRGQLLARVDSDKGTLEVSRTMLRKYLTEHNISSREFETTMRELRILAPLDSRVRLASGWKSAVSLEPVWCYVFNTPFPAEWEGTNADYKG